MVHKSVFQMEGGMDVTTEKKHIKFFVSNNNSVTIVCPNCGFVKQLDASRLKHSNKEINANCKCGESFFCSIEFRKFFRKKVKLRGDFVFPGKYNKNYITICDISQQGLRFTMSPGCKITEGDILEVNFELDNDSRTAITKQVKVKSVQGQSVGCQFTSLQEYERDLGFYLRS